MHKGMIDMTQGTPWKQILRFTGPVFLGLLFQQLYNTVDSIIVGNFLGSNALAAVSSSGNLIHMIVGLVFGFAQGAAILIARYFGARDQETLKKAVHTDITFGCILGVAISVVGVLISPWLLRAIDTPPEMMADAVAYYRVYFGGLITLALYNICESILRSTGDSTHPLYYLIVCSLVNIVLDLVFVGAFRLGVAGAALATVIAQGISALLCMRRLMRGQAGCTVRIGDLGIDRRMLGRIVGYGLPAAVQGAITSFGNVIMQANINQFGVYAVAGCGAYSKIDGFTFLPIDSFTTSIATFVGQNLGARQYDRAREGVRFGLIAGVVLAELMGVVIYAACPFLVSWFDRTPEVIAYGAQKAHTQAPFYYALAGTHCIASVLRGAGRTRATMVIYILAWVVIRVAFVTVVMGFIQNIQVVNWAYPLTWNISLILFAVYMWKSDWIHSFERE